MRITPRPPGAAALVACAPAVAADLLEFYVGAGVGQIVVDQDYYQIDSHVTGWKAVAGWRPLDLFGAEVEYADFGSKDVTYMSSAATTQVSTDAHATAAFALLYLPVPLPWIDLYAKAGPARVQSNTSVRFTPVVCPAPTSCPTNSTDDSSRTSAAWGAGAQFKFGLPAIRLEYERFAGSQGTDELLSLAVTANF